MLGISETWKERETCLIHQGSYLHAKQRRKLGQPGPELSTDTVRDKGDAVAEEASRRGGEENGQVWWYAWRTAGKPDAMMLQFAERTRKRNGWTHGRRKGGGGGWKEELDAGGLYWLTCRVH